MLKLIRLARLRNNEFIQFIADLISILSKHNPKELEVEEQLKPIEEGLEKMNELQGTAKGSEISNELEEIDDRRDDSINGIEAVAQAYTLHYDEEFRNAANLLLNKIANYGNSIARQNYPTETASLNGLSADFKNSETLQNALKKLNLFDWAVKMDEDNTFFNQRYLDRVDETSKKNNDKMKDLRKSTIDDYLKLRVHLNAHCTLNQAKFSPILNELNQLIEKYNLILKRRQGGKNGGEK